MLETLGGRVRQVRLLRNMTQGELGIGICSASAVSQIERNVIQPTVEIIAAFAERLRVPLDHLVNGSHMDWKEEAHRVKKLMEIKDYEQAIFLLEGLVGSPEAFANLSKQEMLYQLGICYYKVGVYDRSIETLEQALGLIQGQSPIELIERSKVHFALSLSYEQQGLVKG